MVRTPSKAVWGMNKNMMRQVRAYLRFKAKLDVHFKKRSSVLFFGEGGEPLPLQGLEVITAKKSF